MARYGYNKGTMYMRNNGKIGTSIRRTGRKKIANMNKAISKRFSRSTRSFTGAVKKAM